MVEVKASLHLHTTEVKYAIEQIRALMEAGIKVAAFTNHNDDYGPLGVIPKKNIYDEIFKYIRRGKAPNFMIEEDRGSIMKIIGHFGTEPKELFLLRGNEIKVNFWKGEGGELIALGYIGKIRHGTAHTFTDLLTILKQLKTMNAIIIVPHPYELSTGIVKFLQEKIVKESEEILEYLITSGLVEGFEEFNAVSAKDEKYGMKNLHIKGRVMEKLKRDFKNLKGIAAFDALKVEDIKKIYFKINVNLNMEDILDSIRHSLKDFKIDIPEEVTDSEVPYEEAIRKYDNREKRFYEELLNDQKELIGLTGLEEKDKQRLQDHVNTYYQIINDFCTNFQLKVNLFNSYISKFKVKEFIAQLKRYCLATLLQLHAFIGNKDSFIVADVDEGVNRAVKKTKEDLRKGAAKENAPVMMLAQLLNQIGREIITEEKIKHIVEDTHGKFLDLYDNIKKEKEIYDGILRKNQPYDEKKKKDLGKIFKREEELMNEIIEKIKELGTDVKGAIEDIQKNIKTEKRVYKFLESEKQKLRELSPELERKLKAMFTLMYEAA